MKDLKKYIKGFCRATNKHYRVTDVQSYLYDFLDYVEWRKVNKGKWARRKVR